MYFDLRTTTIFIKKLLKRHPILSTKDEKNIGEFFSRVFKITETFNDVIASINLNVYTKKGDQFQKAFNAYKDGKLLLPDKYMREFNVIAATIEPVRSDVEYIMNSKYSIAQWIHVSLVVQIEIMQI